MKLKEEKILYSFEINLKKKVEEKVEKKKKRKNKETGKIEVVTSHETLEVEKEVPFNMIIRKPTRTQLEDGDMFYSLQLNKLIKLGLLTKAMLAKQYGSQGGVWTEKEQKIYADLVYKLHQKELEIQNFSILGDKDGLSKRQKTKLDKAIKELAQIRKSLTEYEMLQNSLFDHTADVKARNKAILWYLLHLTYFVEGEADDAPTEEMFEGDSFEERRASYQDKEDSDDELYVATIDKLSSIVTIWYISGVQSQDNIDNIIEEMKNEAELTEDDEELEEDLEEIEDEKEAAPEEEVVSGAK